MLNQRVKRRRKNQLNEFRLAAWFGLGFSPATQTIHEITRNQQSFFRFVYFVDRFTVRASHPATGTIKRTRFRIEIRLAHEMNAQDERATQLATVH